MSIVATNGSCYKQPKIVILIMGGGKYSFYLESIAYWFQKVYNGVSPGYMQNGKHIDRELLVSFDYEEFKCGDDVSSLGYELGEEYNCDYYGQKLK
jgi:hypothetical protein